MKWLYNILSAEKATEFVIKKLNNLGTPISLALLEKFETRVNQKRNPDLVHLLKYLESPKVLDQCDQFGVKIKKAKITSFAGPLFSRLFSENCYCLVTI